MSYRLYLSIVPIWNWNFELIVAVTGHVVYQLYLSGIETHFTTSTIFQYVSINCTYLELKRVCISGSAPRLPTINCTYLELKPWSARPPSLSLWPINCTYLELKRYVVVRFPFLVLAINCTYLELKLTIAFSKYIWGVSYQLYLSGIETPPPVRGIQYIIFYQLYLSGIETFVIITWIIA